MQIVSVNKDRYLVLGTVSADKVVSQNTDYLKQKYHLADTVLKNGNTFYVCMKLINVQSDYFIYINIFIDNK